MEAGLEPSNENKPNVYLLMLFGRKPVGLVGRLHWQFSSLACQCNVKLRVEQYSGWKLGVELWVEGSMENSGCYRSFLWFAPKLTAFPGYFSFLQPYNSAICKKEYIRVDI